MIKNGFRTSRLFPIDADAVPFSKFFKNVVDNSSALSAVKIEPTRKN